jgi:excinuclease ABC subunit C
MNETGTPDDFLAMREVIYRRFKKIAQKDEQGGDKSFDSVPDLIVIDGGKGQLSSAVKVLNDIGLEKLNVIGLAKRLEEVYLPGNADPQSIPHTSSGLKLIQQIRDEAHRFAITFHRSLRDKRTLVTELTEIQNIGDKTAKKLLTEFGSVENIKEALVNSYDSVEKSAGKKTAQTLKEYFFDVDSE